MLKQIGVILILVAVFCTPAVNSFAKENPSRLDFAINLFGQQDYFRAVTEAKRFVFINPDSPRRHEAHLLIADASVKLNELTLAKQYYRMVITQSGDLSLSKKAVWGLGRAVEASGNRAAVYKFYQNLVANPPLDKQAGFDLKNNARIRLGWLNLEDGQWFKAQEILSQVDQDHSSARLAMSLGLGAEDGKKLAYKNPRTAGLASAVLPGAGQLYVGRPTDAALSFGLNAVFTYAVWESYRKKSWAALALFSITELSFYTGNIYNAVNGAHIHNRTLRGVFLKKLRLKSSWHISFDMEENAFIVGWQKKF